jgi:predicted DNA-binding protein (MmcQ/YjbR family)
MTADEVREFCLSLPNTNEDMRGKKTRAFRVGIKWFAYMGTAPGSPVVFKSAEEQHDDLLKQPGISPGPYFLARANWIAVDLAQTRLRRSQIQKLIRQSYDMVNVLPDAPNSAPSKSKPRPKAAARKKK